MHHTAAKNLNPARPLAETASLPSALEAGNVHLRAWLRKREMMGTELRLRIRPEQLFRKYLQRSFQIRKGNVLVNNQTFKLMERRGMGGVHFVGAEHTPRRNHTDRKLPLLHHTGLNRGRLGTQHNLLIHIEGILLILSRMPVWDIQLLEIIHVVLYVRPLYHLVAHADENTLHLF